MGLLVLDDIIEDIEQLFVAEEQVSFFSSSKNHQE
jgi:hypothetical protein